MLLLALAVALTAAHCLRFRDFTVDDAAISYAYSQSFAHGDGLVAVPGGERVEGYSNFLWVLLVGAVVTFAGHVMIVAKLLGLLLAVAITLGAAELLAALRRQRSPLDALPALLCAAFLPIPYWSMSGLENPLFLALSLWCAVRLVREQDDATLAPWSALLAAGVALTRPDGLVVAAAAGAAQLLSAQRLRALPRWLLLAATPIAAHLLWRWIYYAYPWPNTYYVKVAFPFQLRELVDPKSKGWSYLLAFHHRYRLTTLAAMVPLSLSTRGVRARLAVLALVVATLFFPIYARGDWMSEGRFAVGAVPLLFALAADGAANVAALVRALTRRAWPGALAGAALAGALVATIVPTSLALSQKRVHNYPVPVEYVAERARQYHALARALEVTHPSVADGDAGGNLLYAGMPLVDIGWLTDGTLAHWGRNPGFVREYVYHERRPTFLRLTGYWLGAHLQDYPEFKEYVAAPRASEGVVVARSAFTVDGVDTRHPLAALGDGAALVGAELTATEVRAWVLALVDAPAVTLTLRTPAGDVAVDPGQGLYPPSRWRAGEVVKLRAPRPAGATVALCAGAVCAPLGDGPTGVLPMVLPRPDESTLERLEALGELESAAAALRLAGRPTRAVAGELFARAERERALGETATAFADYARALAYDPSRSFARRRLEELRAAPRAAYHPERSLRLGAAVRAFHLAPDAAHLATLVRLADAADEPLPAVRAHLATGIAPPDAATAITLGELYLAAGLPVEGAALLPAHGDDAIAAARSERVARAAGRQPPGDGAPRGDGQAVAPGLVLDGASARLDDDGGVTLALALRRSGAVAGDTIPVGGRAHRLARPPSRWADGERVCERVPLAAATAGRSVVDVGRARVTLEVTPFSADFERGGSDGWAAEGVAFETPVRTQAWRESFGVQGNGYVASKDWGRGRLRSPPLASGVAEVCFDVNGGDGSGVRLESGRAATPLHVDAGAAATAACLRVPGSPAGPWRIAILDGGDETHVVADDFTCWAADGAPLGCAGASSASTPALSSSDRR